MKKMIAAVLIAILLFMTGCSSQELAMYSLVNEISRLDITQTTGSMKVSVEGTMFEQLLSTIPPDVEPLRDILRHDIEIKYIAKQKKNPVEIEMTMDIRCGGRDNFQKLTTIRMTQEKMYIKLDDVLAFARPYIIAMDPSYERTLEEILGQVEYLEMDLNSKDYQELPGIHGTDPVKTEKLVNLIKGFTDIFRDSMREFTTGAVTRKPTGYELKLQANDVKKLVLDVAKYLIHNIDPLMDKIIARVGSMTEDELQVSSGTMGGIPLDKEQMVSQLEEFRTLVKGTPVDVIDEAKNNPSFNRPFDDLEGSTLTYFVGKLGTDRYTVATDLLISYQNQFCVRISVNDEICTLSSFSIVAPQNAVSSDELENMIGEMAEWNDAVRVK